MVNSRQTERILSHVSVWLVLLSALALGSCSSAKKDELTLYLESLQFDEALQLIDKRLEKSPNNPDLLYQKSLALVGLDRHEEAIEIADNLIEHHDRADAAYALRARVRYERAAKRLVSDPSGELKLAHIDCNKVIGTYSGKLGKSNAAIGAHVLRGHILAELGNYEEALDDAKTYLKYEFRGAPGYILRGHIYTLMGEEKLALKNHDKAIGRLTQFPLTQALAYNARGITYREFGHFEEAVADADMAYSQNPRAIGAIMHRGLARLKMGEVDAAKQDFAFVLKEKPQMKALIEHERSGEKTNFSYTLNGAEVSEPDNPHLLIPISIGIFAMIALWLRGRLIRQGRPVVYSGIWFVLGLPLLGLWLFGVLPISPPAWSYSDLPSDVTEEKAEMGRMLFCILLLLTSTAPWMWIDAFRIGGARVSKVFWRTLFLQFKSRRIKLTLFVLASFIGVTAWQALAAPTLPNSYFLHTNATIVFGVVAGVFRPPIALALMPSGSRSNDFLSTTSLALFPLRVVNLVDRRRTGSVIMSGDDDNLRSSANWESLVESLMDCVPLMVADGRYESDPVSKEIDWILRSRTRISKTIVVENDDGRSPILDSVHPVSVHSLRRCPLGDIPHLVWIKLT